MTDIIRITALEIRRLDQTLEKPLAEFFRRIRRTGDDQYFHPHAFDDDTAHRLTHYTGNDLHYVIVNGSSIFGYGMLRGWDEGYNIPSLGIAILDEAKGIGLGKTLIHFLHAVARHRGASHVRIKVYPNNIIAVKLYQEIGYIFQGEEAGQLVGIKEL